MRRKKRTISKEYRDFEYENNLKYIRPVLLMSIVLYAIFGLFDYAFYEQYVRSFHRLRFGLVIPLLIIGYVLSYGKNYRKYHTVLLSLLMLVSGVSIIYMIFLIDASNYYYNGLSLVIVVAFLLLKIDVRVAALNSLFMILLYLFIGFFYLQKDLNVILVNSTFYLSFLLVGIIGSIHFDSFRKSRFYFEKQMSEEKIILEKTVFEKYEEIKHYHEATVFSLATLVESRDEMTGNHIQRVRSLCEVLTSKLPESFFEEVNMDKDVFVNSIGLASILHDIGKINISDTILNKAGSLTDEEFEIMKKHTIAGYDMLSKMNSDFENNVFINLGMKITRSHHERWDGTGYPDGLKGSQIPLSARIVAIIDVYDALISKRPYKEAFSKKKSIGIMKECIGKHFDPALAKIFIRIAESSHDIEMFG